MKLPTLFAFAAGLALLSRLAADPLKVGDAAPAVTGVTDTGATLNLGDVYKQQTYTLVYFYPKADTHGCTLQGCSLRDDYSELTKKGVAVIGVSHDDVAAQKAFKEKYHFPFTLIADTDQAVVKAFGGATRKIPVMTKLANPPSLPDQEWRGRLGRLQGLDDLKAGGRRPKGPGRTEGLSALRLPGQIPPSGFHRPGAFQIEILSTRFRSISTILKRQPFHSN